VLGRQFARVVVKPANSLKKLREINDKQEQLEQVARLDVKIT